MLFPDYEGFNLAFVGDQIVPTKAFGPEKVLLTDNIRAVAYV